MSGDAAFYLLKPQRSFQVFWHVCQFDKLEDNFWVWTNFYFTTFVRKKITQGRPLSHRVFVKSQYITKNIFMFAIDTLYDWGIDEIENMIFINNVKNQHAGKNLSANRWWWSRNLVWTPTQRFNLNLPNKKDQFEIGAGRALVSLQ